jgi:uncharacterized protein
VTFLIKPASGRCNLACRYCFYRDVAEHRETEDFGLMDSETADLLVDRAFELDADLLSFGFQGGEPTLAGLPFFERFTARAHAKAAEAAEKRPERPVRVQFTLQTNGTTVTPEWARFFKREEFLIGVSIDGPRLLHDAFRVKRDDSPTYSAVMDGVSALRAEGVPMNALCVVDAATADNAATVYRHLRSRGFEWLQFIPCLDPLGEEPGGRSWSLTPAAYTRFLKTTFDLRYQEWRSGVPVNVRWVDNLVTMAMGGPPESCGMSGVCSANYTIEADGSVYPCDFYVTDEWKLGNLRETSFAVMQESGTARRFVESSRYVDTECLGCFAYALCRGGCRRDREPFVDEQPALNRYCSAFKDFFSYAGSRIMEMAQAETEARERAKDAAAGSAPRR